MRRRRILKLLKRAARVVYRVLGALTVIALLPLALPLAVPFLALAAPGTSGRVLRDHVPWRRPSARERVSCGCAA